ncbi:Rieske (2Fe-2S) protein [Pseudonocardia adelaidensis]|uniref:Cytochrome bc1 complex Rieske iron-sulfur subunit n=1 Tax=Pseudonocardia adelaidensis TaxID=648754 RepID=A0ABP9NKF4_9PSEU
MQPVHSDVPRRAFVAGTCGAACVAVLSGCATYEVGVSPAQAPAAPGAQGTPAPGGSTQGGGGAHPLTSTADVPVGGGTVFADQDVVVTQPAAGEFRAFSATCTHQGCKVGEVVDGTINCKCHGSKFAVEDGSVVHGPARKPLPERQISVTGEDIVLA